jgi:hypothetical protein
MNLKDLVNGWTNYIFDNPEAEKIAYNRAKICSNCPSNKKGNILVFLEDKLKHIEGNYCDLCGCPLSPKLRSKKEKCDANKW